MNFTDAIAFLEKEVPNPSAGLPDELFYYISKTTPLVNVDLLIKDENGRILLAWREDPIAGIGWHIPGGIIRFKETFAEIEYSPAFERSAKSVKLKTCAGEPKAKFVVNISFTVAPFKV